MNAQFAYVPNEMEKEKASNSYLMSLIAVMSGLPLPIINLLASLMFYLSNRRSTYFVRWHCTQTLLSQATLLIVNSIGFSWTMSIAFGSNTLSNTYFAYMITIITFNLLEFIFTIAAAIKTRKGEHVQWWFWGTLTNIVCKPSPMPAYFSATLQNNSHA